MFACLEQLIVVMLILKRARVKALVKDLKAATVAFGSYVEVIFCPQSVCLSSSYYASA